MPSEDFGSGDRRVQVGDCPNCGYVVGELDFPMTPTCEDCGSELDRATVARESEVSIRVR